MKQKYYVNFEVTTYFKTEVEAKNIDEAMNKSIDTFSEADFGEAMGIYGNIVSVYDENDNIVWEE